MPRGVSRTPRVPAPPILLAALYLALILAGTALLALPAATTEPIGAGEAFFTATSAVTVTGLALVDTGSGFTLFGQAVILCLIQIGGVGLMTFAVLVLSSLGLHIGSPSRQVLREDLNQSTTHDLTGLVASVIRISLIVEALGVAALSLVFVPEMGVGRGLWFALFHSVSAFNNAGFGLRPDSLSAWVANPLINICIPALIMVGGLGFVVIGDVLEKRRWRLLGLHSKLMLVGTAGLTLYGMAVFAALEWTNPGTLGELGAGAKLAASWFQSVTTRTAGFNTVDIARLHDSTTLSMIALMLVGGGSASTAGGIKVTTLMVALLATVAFFQRRDPRAFGRRIGQEQVMKVMALTTIALLTMLTALFLVSISHDGDFLDLAFEIASAFATVGLSRGATGELDTLGRAVAIVLMFMGRVGPLTFGYLLATRLTSRVRFPEGRVYLG